MLKLDILKKNRGFFDPILLGNLFVFYFMRLKKIGNLKWKISFLVKKINAIWYQLGDSIGNFALVDLGFTKT